MIDRLPVCIITDVDTCDPTIITFTIKTTANQNCAIVHNLQYRVNTLKLQPIKTVPLFTTYSTE